jgi:aspartyl protease family protein
VEGRARRETGGRAMNLGFWLLLGVLAAAALAILLPADATIGGVESGAVVAQLAFGLVAVSLIASLAHRYRGRFGAVARDALIWCGITLALVAGYAYRDQFAPIVDRIKGELNPGAPITTTPGVVEIARRRDGHYLIDMLANDAKLSFVFDTGASSVVIRAEDARKIGVDPDKLDYGMPISTANGASRAAQITLDRLAVGSIAQTRVRALVARPGALRENLLGMSFLERLSSFGVEKERLVLRSK